MGRKKKKIVERELFDINDENLLQEYYVSFYPAGSGPLGVMRVVCQLIEAIAAEKGFELLTHQELQAKNRHCN